jgi:hypothetical protein
MPVPIFEQSTDEKPIPSTPPADRKVSGVAVFFSVVLVAILIFTMELALRDVNKLFNSQYDVCYQKKTTYTLFRSVPPNELCEIEKYDGIRLLLHTDIIIPVILISILLLYIYRQKKLTGYLKVLHTAYIFFILWICLRIIGETEYFLIKHHPLYGKYIILITIIILFIFLIIYIQRKFQRQP